MLRTFAREEHRNLGEKKEDVMGSYGYLLPVW
jgi:hypothetical protein